jgi:hypothetical protein
MNSIARRLAGLLPEARADVYRIGSDQKADRLLAARSVYLVEASFEPHDLGDEVGDLLFTLLVVPSTTTGGEGPDAMAFFAIEDMGYLSARVRTRRVQVSGIPLGRIGDNENLKLVATVCRVPRTRMAKRIIDDMRRLLPAIDYEKNRQGSQGVAESLFDRIDVLAQIPGFALILGGSFDLHADDYNLSCALLSREASILLGQSLVVSEGRLSSIVSSGRIETWQDGSFVLIEIGQRSGATFARGIDQLREQRRLITGTPVSNEAGLTETESYVARDQRLRRTRDLAVRFGQRAFQRPVTARPLCILLAPELMDAFTESGEVRPKFKESLTMLRDGLFYESGFRVPEIDVRSDAKLSRSGYALALWEIPVVYGTLNTEHLLVNDTVERLTLLNIRGEPTTNPVNGSECAWIDRSQEAVVKQAGLTTWDAEGYVILHISALARKNYAELFTFDMAAVNLKDSSPDLYRRICQAPGGLSRFTIVLRSLLNEEVTVRLLRPISEQYLEMVARGIPHDEIVEALRCGEAIQPHLRTNKPRTPIWKLGPKFTNAIRDGININGSGRVLALEPTVCQELLSAVRTEVGHLPPTAQNPVVVVDDWQLRPHVRRLIELEFPHLAVVAHRELIDPGASPLLSVIDID